MHKAHIQDVLKKLSKKCDYLEIRVEEYAVCDILVKGKKVEVLREAMELGGCARAYHKGGVGFSSFNTLDEMEAFAKLAVEQARLVGREKTNLAPAPVVKADVKAVIKTDPRSIPLTKKLDILKGYSELILSADPRIPLSSVRYRDSFKTVYFGNSEGTLISQERMDVGANIAAIASDGSQTQMGHIGTGSSVDFGCIYGQEERVKEACRTAAALLDAPPVKGGVYTIIIDPHLAGTFVHEGFGHISEAEKVYENKHLYELMKFGSEFGRPIFNVYDSGVTPGSRGSIVYDEEGIKTEKTYLIRDGKLCGRLHTRETAGKLGEKPTGSARAMDYHFPPIPRMRNTCIEAGKSTFAEMLEGIKEGVYAVDAMGGQAEEIFTFTAGHAFMIRNGKLCEMVKNVTVSGNLFSTLKNIDMIGNDFVQQEGAGGCGKGDGWKFQFPLPVASGAPHIRIQNLVVSGK
jgi:TldD protein